VSQLPSNKQLRRTVIGRRGRGACASFHYEHAPRWTAGHAAAELRRWAAHDRRVSRRWVAVIASFLVVGAQVSEAAAVWEGRAFQSLSKSPSTCR
jgi:hypothetical protein